jgi:hypothetical protein
LAFEVTSDEEIVYLTLLSARGKLDLGERAHHYVLLTLARRRLRDLESGLPDRGSGWVNRDEWVHDESFQPPRLNLYVHRIRQQFAAQRICDAYGIIERRGRGKQMRLGLARAVVTRI